MILVDSDVVIAHLRGHSVARDWLRQTRTDGEVLAVSAVCVAEVVGGMRSGERREVSTLLDSLSCLPLTAAIGYQAGALRRQFRRSHNGIGLIDYLVAATAEVHGCTLATLNVKHFPMFDGLQAPFELGRHQDPA
jgi:predicted nucleic acid-binding protein